MIGGAAEMAHASSNMAMLQISAPEEMRGRISALLMLNPAFISLGALVAGPAVRRGGRAQRLDAFLPRRRSPPSSCCTSFTRLTGVATQMKPSSPASRALVDDLVAASRILAQHEVLDAYGHVSARSDSSPERFVMSRSLAPALVTAADLMELDADSEPLPGDKRKGFLERYIHGEIYRARPEVMAVVHSHSPSVIPFGVTRTKLRPIYHMGSFLWSGAPVFDIRKVREPRTIC